METVKKQADQITVLEETLAEAQESKQLFSEGIKTLQAEYDELEQENVSLKKDVAKKEEKRLSSPKKTEYDLLEDGSGLVLESDNINVHEMNGQIECLKSAIRYLRAENAHLKGTDVIRSLKLEQDSLNGIKQVDAQTKALVRSFALETRMLVKDMRIASASPKVIQLCADRRGGKWQSEKRLPDYQYQTQQSVLYTLKQRCDQLKEKMVHAQKDRHQQQQQQTSDVSQAKVIFR